MPKKEGKCPRCGKVKAKFEISPDGGLERTDEVGGWYPLFKETGPNEWIEDWSYGLAVRCKCGRLFFIYGLGGNEAAPEVAPDLKYGLSLAWFCKKCGNAFINQDMVCPFCRTHY
jgi:hypothetical protein